jgi:Protein of unknown function (DUF2384)
MTVTLRRHLDAMTPPATVLERLHVEIGLLERDIARATGANERSVRRWLGGAPMQARSEERIDDLRAVVLELAEAMPPNVIVNWLRARNRVLGLERPLDVLGQGEFERVRNAIEALRSGEHV